MGFIKEIKHPLGTLYGRYGENGELIQKAGVLGFSREYKEQYYFIITDLNGRRISEVNDYLNNKLINANFKQRELAFTALKLFYSYIDLFNFHSYNKGFEKEEDLRKLISFLEGGIQKGTVWNVDIKTTRSNVTINNYLSVYRDFYTKVFGIRNSLLHDKSVYATYSGGGVLGHANKKTLESYNFNKKTRNKRGIPKYIKEKEYEKIIELIENEYSLRELVIVKLMYEYGCRLGEVLGLTLEDIQKGNYDNYILYIRNRLSDKPYQSAKGVLKIKDVKDYGNRSYEIEGYGYQTIVINEEMADLIFEYIDDSRDEFLLNSSKKKKENLEQYSKADKVEKEGDLLENYYIFLSEQHYKPLTQGGWNYILRNVFEKLNISLDKEVRGNNLSHRFRHGFAMKKVKEGYSQENLAALLRHSDINSVKKYFNPDEEYKVELLNKQRGYMKQGGLSFDN